MTDTTRHQTDASFSSPKKERALRSPDVRRETDESYKSPERSDGDFEKIALPEIFVTRIRERGYKIDTDKHITSGTFSSIYYAKKYNSDGKKAHLAAKVIDLARTPTEVREKFIPRELWCITKLHHKFIIQVYDVFTSSNNKHVVILMELAKGGDLLSYLTHANKAASESRAKIWFKQVTLALNYLHENKVAHRDLKSENILLDEHHDVAKLSDFGFARVTVDTRTGRRLLSETYCGTTGYIAPEILDGKPYDPRKCLASYFRHKRRNIIKQLHASRQIKSACLLKCQKLKKLNPPIIP